MFEARAESYSLCVLHIYQIVIEFPTPLAPSTHSRKTSQQKENSIKRQN